MDLRQSVRALFALAAAILVLAVIVSPLADVVLFGIHDHVAAAQTTSGFTVADAQGSHHCEVWMSPADVTLAINLPATLQIARLALQAAVIPIVAEPLPSFPPPRT